VDTTTSTQNTDWLTPDRFRKGIAAVGIGALLWFKGLSILSFLSSVVWTGVNLAIGAAVLGAVTWLIYDGRIFLVWKLVMNKVFNTIWGKDPIGLMEISLGKLKKMLQRARDAIGRLTGIKQQTQAALDEAAKNKEHELQLASAAKGKSDAVAQNTHAMQATSYDRSMQGYDQKLQVLNRLLGNMNRLEKYAESNVSILSTELTESKNRLRIAEGVSDAVSSFWSIIRTGKERDLFQKGMQIVDDKYFASLGEAENLTNMSEDMLNAFDLDQGVLAADGLKMLDDWEDRLNALESGSSTTPLIMAGAPAPDVGTTSAPKKEFANLLGSKKK
jgi:phage shock protein A